jgi:hypothetical protein
MLKMVSFNAFFFLQEAFWPQTHSSNLYEICFPIRKIRFTKTSLKNPLMTEGLLNSRRTKQKHTLTDPSENTRAKYRNFCKIYFKIIRAAKKLTNKPCKRCKKTWSVFNKILGRSRSNNPLEKINVNGTTVTDPVKIANEFNGFFFFFFFYLTACHQTSPVVMGSKTFLGFFYNEQNIYTISTH